MDIAEIDTRAGYNLWAETYDTSGNPLVAIEEFALDEVLGPLAGRKAIDLGCGTGRNSRKLAALGAQVTGVDFSEGMLAKAGENSQRHPIQYIQADLSQPLPFAPQEFDLVLSSLVIEHLENLTAFFRETHRICKPEGKILITDLHPSMRLKDAQAQFSDHATGKDYRPKGYPHEMREYILSIRDAGLEIAEMREYRGLPSLATKVPKMKKYLDWPMLVLFSLR